MTFIMVRDDKGVTLLLGGHEVTAVYIDRNPDHDGERKKLRGRRFRSADG